MSLVQLSLTILQRKKIRLNNDMGDNAMIVALISGLCVGIPSVIATLMSNNKSNTLMNYRIDELTKKVEKHNQVVERVALLEKDTQTIWKQIDEIK